jgi:small-conductance mechanosensitive channel
MDQFFSIVVDTWRLSVFTASDGTDVTVGQIVLVLLLIVVGIVAGRIVQRILARRLLKTRLQADAAHALERILFYSIVVVVVMTALSLLHIPLTAFAFVSGAVAIGVGFGAQNIINNFISGWILMSERPVRIGDFIEIDGAHGVVETIGARSTRIRRVDGVHLLVPNSRILETTVVNWTLVDRNIRTMLRVGVAYGSPVRLVAELFERAVTDNSQVLATPKPVVVFEDFGDSALIFDAYFWCDVGGERELRQIRSEIRFKLEELFREHDITVPFPQRDVHLSVPREIPVAVAREAPRGEAS